MNTPDDSTEIDIEAAALPWRPPPPHPKKPTASSGHYLRGPIPWGWLKKAIEVGAVNTGLAIWHFRALKKNMTFSASLYQLRKWTGLSKKSHTGRSPSLGGRRTYRRGAPART
jgi:hypothetical protein